MSTVLHYTATAHPDASAPGEKTEAGTCWICLGEEGEQDSGPIIQPCLCPRQVHQKCLARWQLQNAGRMCVLDLRTCLASIHRYVAAVQTQQTSECQLQ